MDYVPAGRPSWLTLDMGVAMPQHSERSIDNHGQRCLRLPIRVANCPHFAEVRQSILQACQGFHSIAHRLLF